jgi:hypothetical protein
MGWVGNATPRSLYPRERYPVPIVQEAGWAPGPFWTYAENFARTGIRFPSRPVRSEWLYRLSRPGSLFLNECITGICQSVKCDIRSTRLIHWSSFLYRSDTCYTEHKVRTWAMLTLHCLLRCTVRTFSTRCTVRTFSTRCTLRSSVPLRVAWI